MRHAEKIWAFMRWPQHDTDETDDTNTIHMSFGHLWTVISMLIPQMFPCFVVPRGEFWPIKWEDTSCSPVTCSDDEGRPLDLPVNSSPLADKKRVSFTLKNTVPFSAPSKTVPYQMPSYHDQVNGYRLLRYVVAGYGKFAINKLYKVSNWIGHLN